MNTKTLSTIKQILKDNKEGITLNLNGNISNNKKGYYCSVTNNILKGISSKDINDILLRAKKIKRKAYIGYWCDKKNNHFLDISLRFLNRNKAIHEGIKHNQQAIFNLNTMNSVFLKK